VRIRRIEVNAKTSFSKRPRRRKSTKRENLRFSRRRIRVIVFEEIVGVCEEESCKANIPEE